MLRGAPTLLVPAIVFSLPLQLLTLDLSILRCLDGCHLAHLAASFGILSCLLLCLQFLILVLRDKDSGGGVEVVVDTRWRRELLPQTCGETFDAPGGTQELLCLGDRGAAERRLQLRVVVEERIERVLDNLGIVIDAARSTLSRSLFWRGRHGAGCDASCLRLRRLKLLTSSQSRFLGLYDGRWRDGHWTFDARVDDRLLHQFRRVEPFVLHELLDERTTCDLERQE